MATSDRAEQRLQVGATLNTRFGQFTAEGNAGARANGARLGARGSLGWVAGLPFASRIIGEAAFAVAHVGKLKGVAIYRENQLAAVTNSKGLALVTGLLPYQTNRLRIDGNALPFNIDAAGMERTARPYARSGVLIDFAVRRSRNVLALLQLPDGSPVPIGAQVTVVGSGRRFVVGRRGEAYLMDLRDDNLITIAWKAGACTLSFGLPAAEQTEPRIGPLICSPTT